ncbi:MAG: hypothetical protein ACXWDO_05275 [Bacteroidia bacterium]
MPLSYTNRRKDIYYVKVALTKSGKQRYYVVKDISRLADDELLQEMPEGFEFHELPYEAQVVFRKKLVSNITQDDFEVVDEAMKNHSSVKDYILEIEKNAIVVFVGHIIAEEFEEPNLPYLNTDFYKWQWYKDLLRFEKENDELFHAQCFVYLEDGDEGWAIMESSDDLEYLANKYCARFTKEGFFGYIYENPFWNGDDDEEQL